MLIQTRPTLREATQGDVQKLANLIHFESFVHRHLDYRPPLDWIGEHPFLVLEKQNTLVAALASPPDPAEVAWVRLFAAAGSTERNWSTLWPETRERLAADRRVQWCAAIPMQSWFELLLSRSGFQRTHSIVMLSWEGKPAPHPPHNTEATIRPLLPADLPDVLAIDRAAFPVLWQNSQTYLELAYRQSAIATLAVLNGKPVGYQISTATPMGGHLARLAVLPNMQERGIGYALLHDLLAGFARRGARTVTVNTQQDNCSSLNLYQKIGFDRTGEEYPIYQLDPHGS